MWRKEHSVYLRPVAKKRGFAALATGSALSGGFFCEPGRIEFAKHRACPLRVRLLIEGVAELGGAVQALRVPADMLTRAIRADLGAVELEHRFILLGDHSILLVDARIGLAFAGP